MHQFLFIRLEGFYSRALPRKDSRPLVIHHQKFVLDVDEHAYQRQVYPGMPLSEAKAILQEGAFVSWEEEPYRIAQAEWLDLCAEISDVIEPAEQHSAWVDLSLQPDAEELAIHLVRKIERQLGLKAIPGLAATKWIARLASEIRRSLGDDMMAESIRLREPVTNSERFLAPLKTRLLTPVEQAHRTRLEFLGYATIGAVARVPLNVLRAQFGDASTHIRMCAKGRFFESVESKYPPDSLAERISFDGVVEDLQVLDNGLQQLAFSISERLSKHDRQAKDVVVTLEHEEPGRTIDVPPMNDELIEPPNDALMRLPFIGGTPMVRPHLGVTVLKRKFTKPIQNYASALASLRLMLTPPPEVPVTAIRVRLENTTHSKRIQQELTGRTSNGERQLGAIAAFQHIRTVFGDAAIQTGSDIVEPRRKQVLRAWKDATGWT
jgi:nucleotidyltransferase/DNA polymerase involved in DNA repair